MPQKLRETAKLKPRETPAQLPEWPALQPLVPTEDLALETLLQGQIITIHHLFTSALCKKYVSFLSSLPLITTPVQPKEGEAIRVNDRIQFDDPAFAEQLWSSTPLRHLVTSRSEDDWGGDLCGLNPRIRIYRYGISFCSYAREMSCLLTAFQAQLNSLVNIDDESDLVNLPGNPPTRTRTTWTLLIYLTGPSTGCVGGETVFYPELGPAKKFSGKACDGTEPVVVDLEVGMALLHKHGQDCLLHEGRKVTKGEKWVIRSDLCVRR